MTDFFDGLETRPQGERHIQQMAALSTQVAHAQQHAPAYAELFRGVDAAAVTTLETLAALPLTRKEELVTLQKEAILEVDRPEGPALADLAAAFTK